MTMTDKQQRLAQHAYRLWEDEGRPHGRHDHHWSEAERLLQDEDLQPVVQAEDTQAAEAGRAEHAQAAETGRANGAPAPSTVEPVEAKVPDPQAESRITRPIR